MVGANISSGIVPDIPNSGNVTIGYSSTDIAFANIITAVVLEPVIRYPSCVPSGFVVYSF